MNQEKSKKEEKDKEDKEEKRTEEKNKEVKKSDKEGFLKKIFKCFSKRIKLIIGIIVLIALIVLAVLIPIKLNNREVLVDFGFKDVGVLVTQEWYGRIVEVATKDRKLFNVISIPFTESKLVFSIDVEVLAGVNFEEIEYDIKKEEGTKEVLVKLPHAYVYKKYIVENTYESYVDSESWFTNINAEEQQTLRDKVTEEGAKKAVELGILDKADKNAENIIRNMIKSNEVTRDYEVKFEYK